MELLLGYKESFSKTITESDVALFAGISGDFNGVHINDIEASKSIFGKRIVHGALVNSYISTVLGTKYPGNGTIYLSQESKFIKPVYINDTVTAEVELSKIINVDKGIYEFKTIVYNQKDEIVLDGKAVIKYNNSEM